MKLNISTMKSTITAKELAVILEKYPETGYFEPIYLTFDYKNQQGRKSNPIVKLAGDLNPDNVYADRGFLVRDPGENDQIKRYNYSNILSAIRVTHKITDEA